MNLDAGFTYLSLSSLSFHPMRWHRKVLVSSAHPPALASIPSSTMDRRWKSSALFH